MGAKQKAGKPIPESLKKLVNDFPAEALDESYFVKKWRNEGICNGVKNPDVFFGANTVAASKVTCSYCPVQEKCLIWALIYKEEGLWGGTTEDERKEFTENNCSYVESLTLRAQKLKKWFPIRSAREILDLAGLVNFFR